MKTNSYNDNLSLSGTASFQDRNGISSVHTETADAQGSLQSTNDISTRQTDRSDNQYLNLNFGKNDFDRPLTNMNLSANMQRSHSSSERNVISVFKSMTVNNRDTSYNRRYLNDNQTFNARANLVYGGIQAPAVRQVQFGWY
jgi:predicted N-acyltransferase